MLWLVAVELAVFWDLGVFVANDGSVIQLLLRLAAVEVMYNLLGLAIMAVSYCIQAGRGRVIPPRPGPGGPGRRATPIQFMPCRRPSTHLKRAV